MSSLFFERFTVLKNWSLIELSCPFLFLNFVLISLHFSPLISLLSAPFSHLQIVLSLSYSSLLPNQTDMFKFAHLHCNFSGAQPLSSNQFSVVCNSISAGRQSSPVSFQPEHNWKGHFFQPFWLPTQASINFIISVITQLNKTIGFNFEQSSIVTEVPPSIFIWD